MEPMLWFFRKRNVSNISWLRTKPSVPMFHQISRCLCSLTLSPNFCTFRINVRIVMIDSNPDVQLSNILRCRWWCTLYKCKICLSWPISSSNGKIFLKRWLIKDYELGYQSCHKWKDIFPISQCNPLPPILPLLTGSNLIWFETRNSHGPKNPKFILKVILHQPGCRKDTFLSF